MSDRYHFIGIGGIGMSSLARILLGRKAKVSGSDIASNYVTGSLTKAGAVVYKGQSSDHIQQGTTIVYSTDIKPDNPEYAAAVEKKCLLLHRSELLARLIENKQSLAVAGTHGKTTTSALLAAVLVEANWDPSFAIGGMLPQFQTNGQAGQGEWFAFEADESDGTFLKYHPTGAIVTNIDDDHLNAYDGKMENLIQAFKQFMGQVSQPNLLFWCGDDSLLTELNVPGQRYGFSASCQWRALRFRQKGFKITFDIQAGGHHYPNVEVNLTGQHNALNALAVFGLAITLGIKEEAIRQAFKNFKGVLRRCEKKGESHDVLFLDDYAHHPSEIAATLKAVRQAVQERRLIVVFQAHRYSRTKDCLGSYGSIFDFADDVVITEIYAAGEAPIPGLSHQQLIDEIKQQSLVRIHAVERAQVPHWLAAYVQPHDVVITLGAGDVTKVGPEVLERLKPHPAKKLKLGLIFGGSFAEHEVSIKSAKHFEECLQQDCYDVRLFGITKSGHWITGPETRKTLENILRQEQAEPAGMPISSSVMGALMDCDVLIPVLHGPFGEDGMIQGLFEVLKKPYVGCHHYAAAAAMDKVLCKKIAMHHGLHTSPFLDFSYYEWKMNGEAIQREIKRKLTFPVFVKPIHLGSTIGITKVEDSNQLAAAIDFAFQHDTQVLVENGIIGREMEFAVLGNDEITVFPPGEILTEGAVYDYQAKYSKEKGIPTAVCAKLPDQLVEEGKKWAEIAYRMIDCSGMARVDFFLEPNGTFWFNELNPIPGFTATSLYPQMCAYHGLKGPELMNRLIILALHRRRQQDKVEHKQLMNVLAQQHALKAIEIPEEAFV